MVCNLKALSNSRYESDLDERYIVICLGQVIGSVTSLSGYIFLVYMVQFIPAYPLVIAAFFQLLEFSLLGTVLTVKVAVPYFAITYTFALKM